MDETRTKAAGVVYHDYTAEKMYELLTEMKARGRAVTVHLGTGNILDIDEGIEFYRRLCATRQALRT